MLDHAGLDDSGLDMVSALLSGGDTRLALHPVTGRNKYQCPPHPAPDLSCAASCTASPISATGWARAASCHRDVAGSSNPARQLAAVSEDLRDRLLGHYRVRDLAEAQLCPSGTDALLVAALAVAASRRGPMTILLPSASETGTGVPLAATCRRFDGPEAGTSLTDNAIDSIEIPTRSPNGAPRDDGELDAAYAEAAARVTGHPVVILTHGSKTGLIAPVSPPDNADVIVDACQSRIEPATVAGYLRRGWPVVVTGSKFFGGPAFSGAVLLPRHRFASPAGSESLGTLLRWTAAMAHIEAFAAQAPRMADFLADRAGVIARALAGNPALVPVAGLAPRGSGWADRPSIFTFAMRARDNPERLLSLTELRPIYEGLAEAGILLGQPVGLGAFGGLRIAIGARDLLERQERDDLPRILAALDRLHW